MWTISPVKACLVLKVWKPQRSGFFTKAAGSPLSRRHAWQLQDTPTKSMDGRRILHRSYMMAPTEVLAWDRFLFWGLTEMLTVALVRSEDAAGSIKQGPYASGSRPLKTQGVSPRTWTSTWERRRGPKWPPLYNQRTVHN